MRSLKIRCMSILLTFFVAFSMVAGATGEVNAASGKITVTVYSQAGENKVYVGDRGSVDVSQEKSSEINSLPVRSVTVSDKSLAVVRKGTITGEYGEKYKAYFIVGKKPGKVKITVKYKLNGKIRSRKKTITIKPNPDAIQSLEINGSKKALKGEKAFIYNAKYTKTKVNVKIIPAEGWEITEAYGYKTYVKNKKEKEVWLKNVDDKVKDGTVISFSKKYRRMLIYVTLEKDGNAIAYELNLHR